MDDMEQQFITEQTAQLQALYNQLMIYKPRGYSIRAKRIERLYIMITGAPICKTPTTQRKWSNKKPQKAP